MIVDRKSAAIASRTVAGGAPAAAAWRPARVLPAPANPSARPMVAVAFVLLVIVYSRAVEIFAVPGLALIPMVVLLVYGLATSRWDDWVRSVPTALLLGLTAWMVPCVFLGEWPGGSTRLLTGQWSRAVCYYLLVVCMARDLPNTGRLMSALAWGTGVIAGLGLTISTFSRGRLAIGTATLANANDLAVYLLFGLPFCVWYVSDRGHKRGTRLLMAGVAVLAVVLALRTGSRMGLIAMGVMLLAAIVVMRGRARLCLMVGTPVAALVVLIFLPQDIQERYQTMVSEQREVESDDVAAAVVSAEGRWQLLLKSLEVTARHPVFGVGPGNFSNTNAAQQGYLASHNAYTQMSSECGIAGGAMFAGLVLYCLRRANRLRKVARQVPAWRAYYLMALCLLLSGVAYSVCAVFGSVAYNIHLPLLAGLVLSLERAFTRMSSGEAAPAARA
jgi:O-antigen ligase